MPTGDLPPSSNECPGARQPAAPCAVQSRARHKARREPQAAEACGSSSTSGRARAGVSSPPLPAVVVLDLPLAQVDRPSRTPRVGAGGPQGLDRPPRPSSCCQLCGAGSRHQLPVALRRPSRAGGNRLSPCPAPPGHCWAGGQHHAPSCPQDPQDRPVPRVLCGAPTRAGGLHCPDKSEQNQSRPRERGVELGAGNRGWRGAQDAECWLPRDAEHRLLWRLHVCPLLPPGPRGV